MFFLGLVGDLVGSEKAAVQWSVYGKAVFYTRIVVIAKLPVSGELVS
jgi:hypothetical protein